MKSVKVLVIEHDEQNRQYVDDVLSVLEHTYDVATCLTEARQLLTVNNYLYVLLADQIPAKVGRPPRRMNADTWMGYWGQLALERQPAVILMVNPMPDVAEIDKLRWAADMRTRGVTDFIEKPLPAGGRTPERVIKKIVAAHIDRWRALITRQAAKADGSNNAIPIGPLPPAIKRLVTAAPGAPKAAQDKTSPSAAPAASAGEKKPAPLPSQWAAIPNEPIDVDEFMARFCEQKGKDYRMYRKRALLAAARHGTVTMPPLAAQHKHGQPNRYWVHDLLRAWQVYRDEDVELPALLPQYLAEDAA